MTWIRYVHILLVERNKKKNVLVGWRGFRGISKKNVNEACSRTRGREKWAKDSRDRRDSPLRLFRSYKRLSDIPELCTVNWIFNLLPHPFHFLCLFYPDVSTISLSSSTTFLHSFLIRLSVSQLGYNLIIKKWAVITIVHWCKWNLNHFPRIASFIATEEFFLYIENYAHNSVITKC